MLALEFYNVSAFSIFDKFVQLFIEYYLSSLLLLTSNVFGRSTAILFQTSSQSSSRLWWREHARMSHQLCRYQFDWLPSPPGTPRLLHQNVCPAPGLLQNRKCPGAGRINDDVPGAGHLHQHKEC